MEKLTSIAKAFLCWLRRAWNIVVEAFRKLKAIV